MLQEIIIRNSLDIVQRTERLIEEAQRAVRSGILDEVEHLSRSMSNSNVSQTPSLPLDEATRVMQRKCSSGDRNSRATSAFTPPCSEHTLSTSVQFAGAQADARSKRLTIDIVSHGKITLGIRQAARACSLVQLR